MNILSSSWPRHARRARKLIRGALVLSACIAGAPLMTGSAIAQSAPPSGAPSGPPSVPVSVGKVARQDVPLWYRGLGTVQALNAVQLRSRVDGTLTQIAVTEGQDVKEGQLLAQIDPRPYQATLSAALAKKQQDEAQLASAQSDLARYQALARQEVASRQKLEQVQALAKQIAATLAGDDAQIEQAQLNLQFCSITAPFAGRVGLRNVDPGNFIRSAEITPLFTLSQIQPIAVTFTLPQDTMGAVQDALRNGKPPVVALSGDDKTELDHGTLLTIDNAIDASTGTIKLKAVFPNAQSRLWPGQFVNTRVLLGTSSNVLTVPSAAVMHGQDRQYVYVVTPEQTVTVRTVKVLRDNGSVTVLESGLDDGQSVVTDGQSRLREGSRISILSGTPAQASAAKRADG